MTFLKQLPSCTNRSTALGRRFSVTLRLSLSALSCWLGLGLAGVAAAADSVVAVSPGASAGFTSTAASSLAFSWTLAPEASGYELVVFRVDESGARVDGPVLVRQVLPGNVDAWSPPFDDTLVGGERYGWAVRALSGTNGEGAWSETLYFSLTAAPSEVEIGNLLDEVEAARGRAGSQPRGARSGEIEVSESPGGMVLKRAGADAKGSSAAPALLATATAAVVGELPDTTGGVVGIAGVTGSASGAGVVAVNLAGGPDLVLSGATGDTSDDGYLKVENGRDLFIYSNKGFLVQLQGSGGGIDVRESGALTAQVDNAGNMTATLYSGNGSSVTNVTATNLNCSNCVSGSEIQDNTLNSTVFADGSLGASEFAAASITGSDFAASGLTGADFLLNTLTAADLGTNSVGASEIATGAVGTSEIASSAVTTTKILDGEVRSPDVAQLKKVDVYCFGGCNDGTLADVCGAAWRPIYVGCTAVDPFTPTTACGGDNQCRAQQLLGSNLIGDHCVDVSSLSGGDQADAVVMCLKN